MNKVHFLLDTNNANLLSPISTRGAGSFQDQVVPDMIENMIGCGKLMACYISE